MSLCRSVADSVEGMESWTVEEVEREAGDAEAGLPEDGTEGTDIEATDIDGTEATDRRSVVSIVLRMASEILRAREKPISLGVYTQVGG
jgi:hypothetical protein